MPRKDSDTDFKIYVDPSCLSNPMEEESFVPEKETKGSKIENQDGPLVAEGGVGENGELSETKEAEGNLHEPLVGRGEEEPAEQACDRPPARYDDSREEEEEGNEKVEEGVEATTPANLAVQATTGMEEANDDMRQDVEYENDVAPTPEPSTLRQGDVEDSYDEEAGSGVTPGLLEETDPDVSRQRTPALDLFQDHDLVQDCADRYQDTETEPTEEASDDEERDTLAPAMTTESDDGIDDRTLSRRGSSSSEQWSSLNTEALIHATARELVASLEANARERSASTSWVDEDTGEGSTVDSVGYRDEEDTEVVYGSESGASRRDSCQSSGSQIHHQPAQPVSGDEAGGSGSSGDNNSSHPEVDDEDDVFSDHSPRSSTGSTDDETEAYGATDFHHPSKTPVLTSESANSPRVSEVSAMSHYEAQEEKFVPVRRETPRMPFRTPSSVRALQLSSSPTSSGLSRSTLRSSRRPTDFSNETLPTVSRLGSPAGSNITRQQHQYTPNNARSPPSRLKPREAPLVLLHVTLLQLRWGWGDVVSKLDDHRDGDLSDQVRMLRDSWRQLQDRVGDTVFERGILLPHPQNDYEVLEERLLEALELPLRRRARILECGHYLGPANIWTADEIDEEGDGDGSEAEYSGDDDDSSQIYGASEAHSGRRHWCKTCCGEIKYESLGPGKVFRIKVYASNGLMRAGAWVACWKEMERVDIEIEPIVEPALRRELERLRANQKLQLEGDLPGSRGGSISPCVDPAKHDSSPPPSSPPRPAMMPFPLRASPLEPLSSSPIPVLAPPTHRSGSSDVKTGGGVSDEGQPRKISTHIVSPTDTTRAEPSLSSRHPDSFIAPSSSPSPSERALQRRQSQRTSRQQGQEREYEREESQQDQKAGRERGAREHRSYATASLQELILESLRVTFRDVKNTAIALLSVLVLILALRPGSQAKVPVQARIHGGDGATNPSVEMLPTSALSSSTTTIVAASAPVTAIGIEASVSAPSSPKSDSSTKLVGGIPASSSGSTSAETRVAATSSVMEKMPSSAVALSVSEQRETTRVFETVTETVRVSVTMTESEAPQISDPSAQIHKATQQKVVETTARTIASEEVKGATIRPDVPPADPAPEVAEEAVVASVEEPIDM